MRWLRTQSPNLIWTYLRPHLGAAVASAAMAALLGAVTAVLGALVGPCLQMISAPSSKSYLLTDLLGPYLGAMGARILGRPTLVATELVARLPLALLILAVVKAALGLYQWYLWEMTGERVARRMRDDFVSSYLYLSPARRRDEDGRQIEADLASAITNDVKMLREYLIHFYGGLPRELLQILFLLATLALLSPKLTVVFLVGVAPAASVMNRVGRKLRRRASKALADYSMLTEWLQQRLLGIETIKHYRTEAVEAAKMETLSAGLCERFLRASRVKARTSPLLEALAIAAMAGVLIVALRDVASGDATGAMQLSFFSSLALLSQAASRLGRYVNSNREGAAAAGRLLTIRSFLQDHPRRELALVPSQAVAAKLVCAELSLRYPGSKDLALVDFNYAFHAGRIYCLVGPSGAGKSTLFQLILGLLPPSAGRLEFAVPELGTSPHVAYMPQKVILLPASIAENVAYPVAHPDRERVAKALAKVGLTEVVAALPAGQATRVGEGGAGLSGGQVQRLLLARLWYQKKPLVLIDEGTSALDPELERTVHEFLHDLANQGSIVIAIAHRLAMAQIADEVLLIEKGRLLMAGPPAHILASTTFAAVLQ